MQFCGDKMHKIQHNKTCKRRKLCTIKKYKPAMSFCSKLTAGLFFYLLMTYLTVGESASEPYNHEMFLKKTLHTPNPLEKMVKYAITKYE